MTIYQGIQLVYAHVVQFVQSIGNWFSEITWSDYTDLLPLGFKEAATAMLVIILAMAAIGTVKKLSFMLG